MHLRRGQQYAIRSYSLWKRQNGTHSSILKLCDACVYVVVYVLQESSEKSKFSELFAIGAGRVLTIAAAAVAVAPIVAVVVFYAPSPLVM